MTKQGLIELPLSSVPLLPLLNVQLQKSKTELCRHDTASESFRKQASLLPALPMQFHTGLGFLPRRLAASRRLFDISAGLWLTLRFQSIPQKVREASKSRSDLLSAAQHLYPPTERASESAALGESWAFCPSFHSQAATVHE